jgi:hypothetical protein
MPSCSDDDLDIAAGAPTAMIPTGFNSSKGNTTSSKGTPTASAAQDKDRVCAGADNPPGDAAQAALADVVQRFQLNTAQATVAAQAAQWLPEINRLKQQQGQQCKGHGHRPVLRVSRQPQHVLLSADPQTDSGTAPISSLGCAQHHSSSGGNDDGGGKTASPVCLIHGPFGSGKSTLLVALCHLLAGSAAVRGRASINGHAACLHFSLFLIANELSGMPESKDSGILW